MKNSKKIKKSIKDIFAFGGTSIDIDSPSDSLFKTKKIMEEAQAESMYDPTVMGLKLLGSSLTSKGLSMAGKGIDQDFGDMENFLGLAKEKITGKPFIREILPGAQAEKIKAASGGTMKGKTEVEGQEVAEYPNGDITKFMGPSHEDGGIKTELPSGTDIYSKRVKVNGESMADRKLKREAQIERLLKLIEKNPMDKNLQNTLKRVQANNEFVDSKDMLIQNTLHSFNQGIKRAYGGTVDEDDEYDYFDDEEENYYDEDEDDYFLDEDEEEYDEDNSLIEDDEYYSDDEEDEEDEEFALGGTYRPKDLLPLPFKKPLANIVDGYIFENDPLTKNIVDQSEYPSVGITSTGVDTTTTTTTNPSTTTSTGLSGFLGDYSLGDIIGMGGSLAGSFVGRKNTLKNRAGDTPNINPFKNYGEKGLETLNKTKESLMFNKDMNLQELQRGKNSAIARNNNSARGLNTQRALNLVTESSSNNAINKVFQEHANKIANIMLQQANMENQKDLRYMTGEATRDMNDRRDRDNFNTQLGIDNQSIFEGIQHFGKNLNTSTERKLNAQALSMLSKWFDAQISADGFKVTNKKD